MSAENSWRWTTTCPGLRKKQQAALELHCLSQPVRRAPQKGKTSEEPTTVVLERVNFKY